MKIFELLNHRGRILKEDASLLTKGSKVVLANKNLVVGIAVALKDDALMHPGEFGGNANIIKKATDENTAIWFLSELDRMEAAGYEGTIASRDGVNNLWIAQRYAAYNDTWEDITGKLQPVMHDFYLLKNRNLLDPKHNDINKFRGIRQLNTYLVTHYNSQVAELRDKAAFTAKTKAKKTIKIADTDDYQVYILLNRAAGCALGAGSGWCTSSSHNDYQYHKYSGEAMLFALVPKQPEVTNVIKNGKSVEATEKYQFGADATMSFKDSGDIQMNPRKISNQFPYLFTDITNNLIANKAKIEAVFDTLSQNPELQTPDAKIKIYDIDAEIKKLHKFVDLGYMTDEVRPPAEPKVPANT